jgi:hypothetical protein
MCLGGHVGGTGALLASKQRHTEEAESWHNWVMRFLSILILYAFDISLDGRGAMGAMRYHQAGG